ncbi:Splicing factor U2af large subunit B (NpU2AF65b) (U2 auxiliary factor 65 kDa subunit B) (U2 small nuclear ribonucleoprotein auxiliary factor large subunit B) (U2 snRNP auxiliary factor large subunit B) [Durusdinium trenchii]|uniref:PDZ domain-containing protein n=2 Tax=Durusdinium trenchii TaxID=1381693 RepID=A0ABP0MQ99_9DINO
MIGGVPVGMQMPGQGGMLALPSAQVSATSPVIRIDEILKVDDKTTDDDYNDVKEDMAEGCGAHGKLVSVAIVKPHHAQGNATLKPGDVFLQCSTTDDATKIMRAMGHRKYDGRHVGDEELCVRVFAAMEHSCSHTGNLFLSQRATSFLYNEGSTNWVFLFLFLLEGPTFGCVCCKHRNKCLDKRSAVLVKAIPVTL